MTDTREDGLGWKTKEYSEGFNAGVAYYDKSITKDSIAGMYKGEVGITVSAPKEADCLFIKKKEVFNDWLNGQLKTVNGKTTGEMNREWLHTKLDEFLDNGELL